LLIIPPSRADAQQVTNCHADYGSPQARIGINVAREEGKEITDYPVEQLGLGWYLDYTWHDEPAHPRTSAPPGTMQYLPMVRPPRFAGAQQQGNLTAALTERLTTAISNNPGTTWILGNEPDNPAQDNYPPDDYAQFYHDSYELIKALDPTARIAMAAMTQVTPLRLRYLDAVLAAYQERYDAPLPVDIWTVHVYMLPEVTGNHHVLTEGETGREESGIGMPPGLEEFDAEVVHFTQDQHDDVALFAEQVVRFRRWLADRGYRNKPLYLTEYGILLSPYHGFDDARVRAFFLASSAYLQQARDAAIGLPADGNRLVQRWAWFSLNFYAFDPDPANPVGLAGLNGNLFDHGSGTVMPLGETVGAFTQRLNQRTVDLAIEATITGAKDRQAHDQQVRIIITNRGDATANGFRVRLWWGDSVLATFPIATTLLPHCGNQVSLPLHWLVAPQGTAHAVSTAWQVQVLPAAGQVEYDPMNNRAAIAR